ncbi:MAG: class I SAM-dependent methyltransferase [Saprospiraceae bacterium]|nr:MAG: class I SAM-dependent methyltransferase [Saprospiraceae bacterium]
MKLALASHLHDHTYPPYLLRHPQWVRLLHAWNCLVLQRNWATRQWLCRLLPPLPPGSLVVDAGCGDGLHLFGPARRFPHLRFLGVDKNEGNIAFCRKYAAGMAAPTNHLHLLHQNLEDLDLKNSAGLLLCIGTLQYVAGDVQVLKNFERALMPEGRLLLYVPINGWGVLPLYRQVFNKMNQYEKSQHRQRVYTPAEIFLKLEMAGLAVRETQLTYGTPGILGHEIYSLLLMGVANAGRWGWAFGLLMVPALPVILLLKGVDYFLPKKNGNGCLVVAEKTGAFVENNK